MLDELKTSGRLVGLKQSLRAIDEGLVKKAFVAKDAAPNIYNKIVIACSKNSIEIEYVDTMKELGGICGIDVGAAVAVLTIG